MSRSNPQENEGRLILTDPYNTDPKATIVSVYADLVDRHGAENVLVLKRLPSGLQAIKSELSEKIEDPVEPRIEALPTHASKVLEEYDSTIKRLSYVERIELLDLVIRGSKRNIPGYLERVVEEEQMRQDVGQTLLRITRHGLDMDDLGDDPDKFIEYLYRTNERFHQQLDERGLIERAGVIPKTTELLSENESGLRELVTKSYSAVLAVEFEEFREIDRKYISELVKNKEFLCIAEPLTSINRIEIEPGSYPTLAPDWLSVEEIEGKDLDDKPDHTPITKFLGLGENTGEEGTAYHIEGSTFKDQIRQIAEEIRYLSTKDYSYEDVGIAVPNKRQVPKTREIIHESGIPTQEIETTTLEEDPVVNELYAFISLKADHENESAKTRLQARVDGYLFDLFERCDEPNIVDAIKCWIRETDLKRRVSETESWIDARDQLTNAQEVVELISFVDTSDLMSPSWEKARNLVERAINYQAEYAHTEQTESKESGVTIGPISDYKYDSYKAIFITELTDSQYPGKHRLGELFPTDWLRRMDGYPAVNNPSREQAEQTFPIIADEEKYQETFTRYYNQQERRLLAIASRAATEKLFFTSYTQESAGLGRSFNISRYLAKIQENDDLHLNDGETDNDAVTIKGQGQALERFLREPNGELERILQEASTGGEANLANTAELFQEIQTHLREDGVDENLKEGIISQFEFASGEVMRNE